MTDYADLSDVFAAYAPIKTMIGSGEGLIASLDVTSRFIPQASALVDGYLARRYSVPLETKLPLVTQVTCDLVVFNMLVELIPQVPDYMQRRYDRALKTLTAMGSGTIVVQSATVLAGSTGDSFVFNTTSGYHSIFSPVLDPLDQSVDADRIYKDKSDRSGDC